MKNIGAIVFALILIACDPETRSGGVTEFPTEHGSPWEIPTEWYTGVVDGAPVTFQHLNYSTFRLDVGGEVIEGDMDTERGYEEDLNATLYILNADRAVNDQAYFVRYTNGSFLMLDAERKPMQKVKFKKVGQ